MGYTPSDAVAFFMLFVTMVCWGSWANALKKCGNWRFEGFYWDYAWSTVVWTFVLGVLLGGVNSGAGWSVTAFVSSLNDFSLTAASSALAAGCVWGLGNILLVVAIELAGFAMAFPLILGLSLVLGTSLAFVTNPSATHRPVFLFAGLTIVLFAVIANGLAYRVREADSSTGKATLKRGVAVSAVCGVLIGLFPFPFNYAFDHGVNGYAGAWLMVVGGFASTAVLLPALMRKPVVPGHSPVGAGEYLRAKPSWRVWAIGAGLVWSIGTVFNLVVASQPKFSVAIAYTMGQCAPMVAAIWGIFVWKEFKGSATRAHVLLGAMFAFYAVGIGLLSQASG